MKLYLAGPMTGLPDFNHPEFVRGAQALAAAGYTVWSPVNNGLNPEAPWTQHMRADIPQLLACDGVALLAGWEDSRGASLERHIAIKLGMPAVPVGTWLRIMRAVRQAGTPATHHTPAPITEGARA